MLTSIECFVILNKYLNIKSGEKWTKATCPPI